MNFKRNKIFAVSLLLYCTLVLSMVAGCSGLGKTWEKESFSSMVLGKDAAFIERKLGQPDESLEKGDQRIWVYRDVIKHPTDPQRKLKATLILKDGKVAQVNL